ncbi:MBL fold metallo-hydrolase [Deinococcus wulumuqiensis]|uniref:Zn-dependent hydrolase n=1 Tax=Deinococcus wulumuqiensis TaxID=980427 RepID=A0AAV4K5Q2_9DEIO|nr:MBL fold metallo-hydrolase [Deinococcus wulumuqiensis]QII22370.1 MBL fold metallo-hydrolase [Deinococcus wulumuqiensis R12]GGI87710.1 Zn-dependent hydrolase [Deinococcus wulumuqiensis]GGP30535.1 Zn-dependent hydrolase [Deinococcus wulumuqiensis]
MFFERFYDTDLAQASYMVGCQKTGECLVIDPVRDIQKYLDKAAEQKLRVTHVTETHIHADYLSGSRELAAATGAKLSLSDEGDADWKYSFGSEKLRHGDTFMVGNIKVEARHTPGHTPESLSFLVTDTPRGNVPVMYFTGDFVFVGDIGRPDLLDEAAGGQDTRFVGARQMFASLRDQFLTLPDGVQVWPAHGSGSACGKALGAVPSTTVGHERALAWWSAYVQKGDEQGFTAELLSGQPDAPLYYGRMKEQNKSGPAVLGEVAPLPEFSAAEVGAKLAAGTVLIDTRAKERHQAAAPRHSVNIPAGNTFETWSGWLLRPEDADYVLLTESAQQAEELRRRLWMVGLDNVSGYVTSTDGLDTAQAQPFAATELPQHDGALVLDVRKKTEYDEGHIPGAKQLHAGRLPWKLAELPRDQEIVVHCQGGARSAAAASFLRSQGFNVTEIAGGYEAWAQAQSAQPTT